ncbi:transposase [Streptomyces sp. NPDC059175]|uniref:transposase n=1 Tax=unclassified Streptomyces TaxID=2593676 RepID=UPI003684B8FE
MLGSHDSEATPEQRFRLTDANSRAGSGLPRRCGPRTGLRPGTWCTGSTWSRRSPASGWCPHGRTRVNVRPGRAEQKTETWKAKYALRAGVEGAINQALDLTGMRRARYRGLPKVRLQHAFSGAALNVIRLDAYWTGHDRHHTRSSRLEHLAYRLTA